MKFEGDGRRFPQAFCIYEGGAFPEDFDSSIIVRQTPCIILSGTARDCQTDQRIAPSINQIFLPRKIAGSDRFILE